MKQFGFLSVISTGQVIMDVPELTGTNEFFHFSLAWIGTHACMYAHTQVYLRQSRAPRCSQTQIWFT